MDLGNQASSPESVALLVLSYGSIVFNSGATVGAFILIDKLGDLPLRSLHLNVLPSQEDGPPNRSTHLLRASGLDASWTWVMWHCESHAFECVTRGLNCMLYRDHIVTSRHLVLSRSVGPLSPATPFQDSQDSSRMFHCVCSITYACIPSNMLLGQDSTMLASQVF